MIAKLLNKFGAKIIIVVTPHLFNKTK